MTKLNQDWRKEYGWKELEGLRDFIKYLETDGRPDDEGLYAYWLGRIGTAEGKIIDACEN